MNLLQKFGSAIVRMRVANDLILQSPISQRADILSLNGNGVQTELIAFLRYLQNRGWKMKITSLRSDHGPDGYLNSVPPHVGTHQFGWAADLWICNAPVDAQGYTLADCHTMRQFLVDCANYPGLDQVGLGGSANIPDNIAASGSTYFCDNSEDHIHISARQ